MSRDVSVWLTRPVDLDEIVADLDGWSCDEFGNWSVEGSGWQVLLGPVDWVEREDVPEAVLALAPSISHLVGLTLEGSGRGAGGRLLRDIERRLALAGAGIIDDSNDRELIDARGARHAVRRTGPPRHIDVIRGSWYWTDESPAESREGLERMLARLEELMPQALPKRYGEWEPPQIRFDDGGVVALATYLDQRRDDLTVMYPELPVRAIDLDHPAQTKVDAGFLANRLTIDVDAVALRRPGWGPALARVFVQLAELAETFYAEVRLLRGFELFDRREAQEAPVTSDLDPVYRNQWRGVPNRPALAAVIGPPYTGRWPEFEHQARDLGPLRVICSPDLARPTEPVPPAPAALCQPFDRRWIAADGALSGLKEPRDSPPLILTPETPGLMDILRTRGVTAEAPHDTAPEWPF